MPLIRYGFLCAVSHETKRHSINGDGHIQYPLLYNPGEKCRKYGQISFMALS